MIEQRNWSVDPVNGLGPSGVVLDPTKPQIFWIDIEWLGAGTVCFGLIVDGVSIICHEIHHANRMNTRVYMTRATLPIRYEVSTTAGASRTAAQVCSTVLSEGLFEELGRITAVASSATTGISCGTAGSVVVGVRLKSLFNRMYAKYIGMDLITTSNAAGKSQVFVVPAANITGTPTWVSAGNDSILEYALDIGTNFSTTNIAPIDAGFFNAQGRSSQNQIGNISTFMASDVPGNSDVMIMLCQAQSGTVTMFGALHLQEFR